MTKITATHQTPVSRRRTGTTQRERIVSKKSKSRTGGKGKLQGEAKHGLPTCDRIVENPERKWRLALAPNETITVAEEAAGATLPSPSGIVLSSISSDQFCRRHLRRSKNG